MLVPLLIWITDPGGVAEPVRQTAWQVVQDAASFLVAVASLAVICYPVARKLWGRYKKKRDAERAQREAARSAEIRTMVYDALAPMREQVSDVHRTTTINGGLSENPTILDKLHVLGGEVRTLSGQVEACTAAVGAVAVNQAALTSRMDEAQAEGQRAYDLAAAALRDQGIDVPEYGKGD